MIKQSKPQSLAPQNEGEATTSQTAILAENRLNAVAQGEQTTRYPSEYDGVQYANIIEAWLHQKGIYGGVAEGNRNNMFYQLALEMRYICNFKKEWLLQVLPTWDMPLAERESTVQSAINRPQGRNIPETLLQAIDKVKSLGDVGEMDTQAISNELRNPLPKTLPYAFRLIARRFPQNPHAMIMCSMPCFGALCTNVHGEYIDGEEESPLFYCILTSPQASGKKVARKLDEMITYPIKEHDDMQRAEIMEYKKACKAAKNAKTQPEEPQTSIRKVPAKISQRVFLERTFYAEGRSLYSFAEELDSLTKGMKGGSWADLSDILRLAFDGGEFGSDYASENSFAAVCRARWCMLMCGTWGAVERFFPNLEDGTMTRFMFAQLEDNVGKPLLPRQKRGVDAADTAIRDEAKRLYDLGSSDTVHHIKLPITQQALLEWQDVQIRIWELGGKQDNALDTLRRRSMLMGFRAALIAAATDKMRDSAIVANFAVWVAQEVLDHQMALFAKGLNTVNRRERGIRTQAAQQMRTNSTLRILADLPQQFTADDVQQQREKRGLLGEPHKTIQRWVQQGIVTAETREGKKYYTKTR